MRRDRKSGQTMSLAIVSVALVALLGIAFFAMTMLLGGGRQLQNAVDAGAVNVAKQASKNIRIDLNTGFEQEQFGAFSDGPGGINLLNYNSAVAQAIQIASNALDLPEGETPSPEAVRHVQEVFNALQTGNNSIGQRLERDLRTEQLPQIEEYFNQFANGNSLKMFGGSPQSEFLRDTYQIGYLTANTRGLSNAVLDPELVHPSVRERLEEYPAGSGNFFLPGYESLSFPELGNARIQGVTTNPGQAPKLVTERSFNAETASPHSGDGGVPPNAFKCVANVPVDFDASGAHAAQVQRRTVSKTAVAMVGAIGGVATEPPMARGYIRVVNEAGILEAARSNVSVENVMSDQLYEGVYVAIGNPVQDPGRYFFSTDGELLRRWIAWNDSFGGVLGSPPPVAGIYDKTGVQITAIAAGFIDRWDPSLGPPGPWNSLDSVSPLTYQDSEGNGPRHDLFLQLIPGMETAYGRGTGLPLRGEDALIAVEKAKAKLIADYFDRPSFRDTRPSIIGDCNCAEGTTADERKSGLRKFDRNAIHTAVPTTGNWNANWNTVKGPDTVRFSEEATVLEYLHQIGNAEHPGENGVNTEEAVINVLFRRLRQIKRNVTIADVRELLGGRESPDIDVLTTENVYYIYRNNTENLTITDLNSAPSWLRDIEANPPEPDGREMTYSSEKYDVIDLIVNPKHECGIHYYLFLRWETCDGSPDPDTILKGQDEVVWRSSCGYRNLLGELRFRNKTTGCVKFTVCN